MDRTRAAKVVVVVVLLLMSSVDQGHSGWASESDTIYLSNLPKKFYAKLGDINIGIIAPISSKGKHTWCTDVNDTPLFERYPDLIAYAVEIYNRKYPLSYNLTLGFVFLDDCMDECVASSQTLPFILHGDCPEGEEPSMTERETYDVVAVLGSLSTPQSLAMAHLLGPAKLPQLSYASTLNENDPRVMDRYFLTVVPPDWEQQRVIFNLVRQHNWTYVSVLYTANVYGESGFSNLRRLFDTQDICIGATYAVPQELASHEEAAAVAKYLVEKRGKARVVVLMLEPEAAHSIINATSRLVSEGTLVWIGTDTWAHKAKYMIHLSSSLVDSFVIDFQDAPVAQFDDWFREQTPNKTTNPWFHDLWERYFNCSLTPAAAEDEPSSRRPCEDDLTLVNMPLPVDFSTIYTGYFVDAAFMIANATDRVLKSADCEGLTNSQARACVTHARLIEELMATRQYGYAGLVELDYNGVRHGRYTVSQLKPGTGDTLESVVVTVYDFTADTVTHANKITWTNVHLAEGLDQPESLCSAPCKMYQVRTYYHFPCCWTCDTCQLNERMIKNATGCESCPNFTLPDTDNHEVCVPKPMVMADFRSVIGAVQTILALLGLCICVYVFTFFIRHKHRPVIKASSVELSHVMLFAITLGYSTIILYRSKPSALVCKTAFMLMGISFTLIYGPLLVRAVRVYRLFKASEKSIRRPRMTSKTHQLLFCLVIVGVQVAIMVLPLLYFKKWHALFELTRLSPYVEHSCAIPTTSAQAVLGYNLMLAAACGVLAFKTRHLPDNFNESRFITICIGSSLVISISFIPTYLVTQQMLSKMLILTLIIFLNHSVALGFLFMPKIYAVVFVEDKRVALYPITKQLAQTPFAMRPYKATDIASITTTSHINQVNKYTTEPKTSSNTGEYHRKESTGTEIISIDPQSEVDHTTPHQTAS